MKKTILLAAAILFAAGGTASATKEHDICKNLDGIQTEVPEGYVKTDNKECVLKVQPVQETPVIVPAPQPAPVPTPAAPAAIAEPELEPIQGK
jgi:hypothetical protein